MYCFARLFSPRTCVLLTCTLLIAIFSSAQESSSKPDSTPTSVSSALQGPIAALRDVLSAACAQNQTDFQHFLTARNKQSFLHLTAPARVAFMKRFVLLNEPGRPTFAINPVGRPTVRCETPAGTAEIQIGGADTGDNLAFLPVEIREANDTIGANSVHVNMGLVHEAGEWKLLSLGLLLLDLPVLEVEWDSAAAQINEQAALESLKKIADAIESYRRTFSRLPESLANLAASPHGAANGEAAGLLDADLASGKKSGYQFRYVILGGSALGAPAKFELAATPTTYGRTGTFSYFRDSAGGLHAADHQGSVGNETDPKVP